MRDFYWRRDGWRWVVATVEQGDGNRWINEVVLLRFWRERSAARACNVIFQTYSDGRDAQRASMSPVMQAAENAAKVVDGWSDSKKAYAARALPPSVRADVENAGDSQ